MKKCLLCRKMFKVGDWGNFCSEICDKTKRNELGKIMDGMTRIKKPWGYVERFKGDPKSASKE